MTYKTLREAYLETRQKLTNFLRYSEELGLEDSKISDFLKQEGFLGDNLFFILSNLNKIQKDNKGLLITRKSIEAPKSQLMLVLYNLKMEVERIEEILESQNGDIKNEITNAVTSYHHSLNKIEDILTSSKLEDLLKQIE